MVTAAATVNFSVTNKLREHLATLQVCLSYLLHYVIYLPIISMSWELLLSLLLQRGKLRHSKVKWLVNGNIAPE